MRSVEWPMVIVLSGLPPKRISSALKEPLIAPVVGLTNMVKPDAALFMKMRLATPVAVLSATPTTKPA